MPKSDARFEPVYLHAGSRMSKAVAFGGLIFTAGQVDTSSPSVAEQTRAVLDKIDALLREAGSDKSLCLSANVWLADIATFEQMNEVWERWIVPGRPPARATVEARLASPSCLVEIAVVAAASLQDRNDD